MNKLITVSLMNVKKLKKSETLSVSNLDGKNKNKTL